MAIDSAFSVSTTGSPVNSVQKSAEDRVVAKQEKSSDNTKTSSETQTSAPVVNTNSQKTGTTINTTA